jgi:MoaA/NifB/PqqE/SkfB family radical SAM enzyme
MACNVDGVRGPAYRPWMELVRRARSAARIVRLAARAAADPYHPILAQIVPMRRCNLACAYCNEYDKVSDPVPLTVVEGWLDRLAALGTEIVTVSGGEPLLHPDLDAIIARIRRRGMIAGLITNGYFLQRERIRRLNVAGLEHLQISIDNVKPDEVSHKSLKVLDGKLVNLAEEAAFGVNVNVVLGSGCARPDDALRVARRARELGFSTSVGIIHDGEGRLRPLGTREREVYDEVTRTGLGAYTRIRGFQKNLVAGRPNAWHCRAGARYLYICEEGRVHYCSQRRGEPGIPLAEYGPEDIRRSFHEPKDCAPYCTIGCVHRASSLDRIRPLAGLRGTMGARETASP